MKTLTTFISLLLCMVMLCSCAPAAENTPDATDEPTAAPVLEETAEPTVTPLTEETAAPTLAPTIEETAEPSAAPAEATAEPVTEIEPTAESAEELKGKITTGEEYLRKAWLDFEELLYDKGYVAAYPEHYSVEYVENVLPEAIDVIKTMMPYITYATAYLPKYEVNPGWGNPDCYPNANVYTDKERVATVMTIATYTRAIYNPNIEKRTRLLAADLVVNEDMVRDITKVCFADYTDDMPLFDPADSDRDLPCDMRYENGEYLIEVDYFYDPNEYINAEKTTSKTYNSRTFLIKDMNYITDDPDGKNRFEMHYLVMPDMDHMDGIAWTYVCLVKNDKPDNLGLNWRIEKAVKMPTLDTGYKLSE